MRTLLLVLALALGAPSPALAQGAAVSAADAQEAETLYERGLEHFAAGRVAVASSHFVAALELDPEHRRARAYLVECLVLDEQIDEARRVARGGIPQGGVAGIEEPPLAQPPMSEPPPDLPVLTDDDVLVAVPPAEDPPEVIGGPVVEPASEMPAQTPPPDVPAPVSEPTPEPVSAAPPLPPAASKASKPSRAERRERTARRNPRALSKVSAGLAIGGAAVTVGGFLELRPTWVGAFEIGIGGFLFPVGDRVVGAAAFSVEGQFSPIPFRLTPIVGGGLMVLGGSGVGVTDAVLGSLPSIGSSRVVPYGVFGARYDLRKRVWFSLSVRLAPSPRTRVIPMPGARVGLRF